MIEEELLLIEDIYQEKREEKIQISFKKGRAHINKKHFQARYLDPKKFKRDRKSCFSKVKYVSVRQAEIKAKEIYESGDGIRYWYKCRICKNFHLTGKESLYNGRKSGKFNFYKKILEENKKWVTT